MNKLDAKLIEITKKKKIGLMTHVVVGYPSLDQTIKIVKTMAENGADIIELQIPFSDPLADGPTIMKACEAALLNGTKVADSFQLMKKLSSEISTPLVFMSYYNIVFKYGVERFCADAEKAGASGLIVPDMPLEEEAEEHFYEYARKYNLYVINVVSPASTDERLRKIAKIATGFIYCTALRGTTGAKDSMYTDLANYLKKVRKYFDIPLAVGFGISKTEHINTLIGQAEIAVIGSAIIDIINNSTNNNLQENVTQFIKRLSI